MNCHILLYRCVTLGLLSQAIVILSTLNLRFPFHFDCFIHLISLPCSHLGSFCTIYVHISQVFRSLFSIFRAISPQRAMALFSPIRLLFSAHSPIEVFQNTSISHGNHNLWHAAKIYPGPVYPISPFSSQFLVL